MTVGQTYRDQLSIQEFLEYVTNEASKKCGNFADLNHDPIKSAVCEAFLRGLSEGQKALKSLREEIE